MNGKMLRTITFSLTAVLTVGTAVMPAVAQVGRGGLIQQQQPGTQGAPIIRNVPTRQPGIGPSPSPNPTPNPSPSPTPQPNPGWTAMPGGGTINNTPLGNPTVPRGPVVLQPNSETFKVFYQNVANNVGIRPGNVPRWDEEVEDVLKGVIGGYQQQGEVIEPLLGHYFDPVSGGVYGASVWLETTTETGKRIAVRYSAMPFFLGTSNQVAGALTAPIQRGEQWSQAVTEFGRIAGQTRASAFGSALLPAFSTNFNRAREINPNIESVGVFSANVKFTICQTCAKGLIFEGDGTVVPIKTFEDRVLRYFPAEIQVAVRTEQLVSSIPRKEAGVSEMQSIALIPNIDQNKYRSIGPVRLLR